MRLESKSGWPIGIDQKTGEIRTAEVVVVDPENEVENPGRRGVIVGGGAVLAILAFDWTLGGQSLQRLLKGVEAFGAEVNAKLNKTQSPTGQSKDNLAAPESLTGVRRVDGLEASVKMADLQIIGGKNFESALTILVNEAESQGLTVMYRPGNEDNGFNTTVVTLSAEDLQMMEKNEQWLPVPAPEPVVYWDGGNTTINVPTEIWDCIMNAAIKEGVNPYLLLALAHSESTIFNPNVCSYAGACGLFQFMPGTWLVYGEGDIFNPVASAMAAAKMIESIGLTANFNAGNGPGFVNSFTGADGSACWNFHPPQGEYVFRAAVALVNSAQKRGEI